MRLTVGEKLEDKLSLREFRGDDRPVVTPASRGVECSLGEVGCAPLTFLMADASRLPIFNLQAVFDENQALLHTISPQLIIVPL